VGTAQQAEDDALPPTARLRRLVAELADARPPGLGDVELLQNCLPLCAVPVRLLDLLLELLDRLGQLGILALTDGHRLLVVLVAGGVVMVLLALDPRLPQVALRLAVVALGLDGERLAA